MNVSLATNAKAAILVHIGPNEVLFAKNIEQKFHMASLTKLMTAAVILDKIDAGAVKWSDLVEISPKAARVRGSTIKLKDGEKFSVQNLFKGMIIASGNDAAVALAEYISGTVDQFVKEMNRKADQLGLSNTHFINPHGLSKKNHYSSALDIYRLSLGLLARKEVLSCSKLKRGYIRKKGNVYKKLVNTNKLIGRVAGLDGLKTGHTPLAGYCLAATARRGEQRVIAIVLGEPNEVLRDQEVLEMLDFAFNFISLS